METEGYVCISADGPCIGRAQSVSASSSFFQCIPFFPAKAERTCDLGNKNKQKKGKKGAFASRSHLMPLLYPEHFFP